MTNYAGVDYILRDNCDVCVQDTFPASLNGWPQTFIVPFPILSINLKKILSIDTIHSKS